MSHPAVEFVAGRPGVRPGALPDGVRVTVNFHPDRCLADGRTVAAALAADGQWRTQFETGITAGSPTAYPGGDRDRWEQALFGPVYGAPPPLITGRGSLVDLRERPLSRDQQGRPAYGGLDLLRAPDGACPRFGSCFLRLRPHVLARATFCAGDSHLDPTAVGTATAFGAVRDVHGEPAPLAPGEPGRCLDGYVEAQIHGGIDLARDVEELVADPSFRGTAVGADLARLADHRGIPLRWHGGFVLDASVVPDAFRGEHLPRLVRRIHAEHGRVDAATLGATAALLPRDLETLQHVKHVWHALVALGRWP